MTDPQIMTEPEPPTDPAGRLDALVMRLVSDPMFLVMVQKELAKLIVFEPWDKRKHCDGSERKEPGKNDARIYTFKEDNGWFYRVGFGVVGLAGFTNEKPFLTEDEAMSAVDGVLESRSDIVVA